MHVSRDLPKFKGADFLEVGLGYGAGSQRIAEAGALGIDDIRPLAERPIVVGYRGRDLGARSVTPRLDGRSKGTPFRCGTPGEASRARNLDAVRQS